MADFFSLIVLAGTKSNQEILEFGRELEHRLSHLSEFYEVLYVRSGRRDAFQESSQKMTSSLPNAVFIELHGATTQSQAAVTGISQSIGDYVGVIQVDTAHAEALERLLSTVRQGDDVAFGEIKSEKRSSLRYRLGRWIFGKAFRMVHGLDIAAQSPLLRVMNRQVVSDILSSDRPEVAFRSFIVGAGAKTSVIPLTLLSRNKVESDFWSSYGSAMQMLLGDSKLPMRIASLLALVGGTLNVFYAIYVLALAVSGENLADGWASTSLQLSGMFFLICVVLFLISEYLLQLLPDQKLTRKYFSTVFSGSKDSVRNVLSENASGMSKPMSDEK